MGTIRGTRTIIRMTSEEFGEGVSLKWYRVFGFSPEITNGASGYGHGPVSLLRKVIERGKDE